MKLYSMLPEYAKITEANVFSSKDENAVRFYSGPFIVDEKTEEIFIEERMRRCEERLGKIKGDCDEVVNTSLLISLYALRKLLLKNASR